MHWLRSFFLDGFGTAEAMLAVRRWPQNRHGELPWILSFLRVCNATGDGHVEVGGSSNGVVTMARRRRQQEGAGSRRSRRGAPPSSTKATKGSLQHPILPGSVYPIFLVDLEHLCVCVQRASLCTCKLMMYVNPCASCQPIYLCLCTYEYELYCVLLLYLNISRFGRLVNLKITSSGGQNTVLASGHPCYGENLL